MNELKIIVPKPVTIYVGRQRLVIRKPNIAWWVETFQLLSHIKATIGIAEAREDLKTGIMAAIMKGSGRKLLLHLISSISPTPRWFFRPILSLWIVRQDPQTILKIVDAWIETVGPEEIKKSFHQAGERLGIKTVPKKTSGSSA